jgi:SAM-dependent methyltransferase
VHGALPRAPARVLEIGAGDGELAARLSGDGYDVTAIDPAGEPPVAPVALIDLDEPAASFDAAVAVVSLHHVEPLRESLARLADVMRPGGVLAVDELDVELLDGRAARWWIERRRELALEAPDDEVAMIEGMREHIHPVSLIVEELGRWFELEPVRRCTYLHRWNLSEDLLATEEELIAAGELPATGARIVGRRV